METKYTLISYNAAVIENFNSDSLDDILSQVQDDHNSWIIIRDCEPSDQGELERLLAKFSADIAFADKILNQIPLEYSDQVPNCLYFEYNTPTPVWSDKTPLKCGQESSIHAGVRDGYVLNYSLIRIIDFTGFTISSFNITSHEDDQGNSQS